MPPVCSYHSSYRYTVGTHYTSLLTDNHSKNLINMSRRTLNNYRLDKVKLSPSTSKIIQFKLKRKMKTKHESLM